MHKITKADIVVSIGRGLIMAAAIVAATYFIGSWYFGGSNMEAIYSGVEESFTPRIEHANAPGTTEAATQ
jgi:hypothetical protein